MGRCAVARWPRTLQLAINGQPLARPLVIERKGPFELRVPRAELPTELPPRITLSLALSAPEGPLKAVARHPGRGVPTKARLPQAIVSRSGAKWVRSRCRIGSGSASQRS